MPGRAEENLYERALAYYRASNYGRCREIVDQLLEAEPRNSAGLVLKGMALLELERPDEAIAVFRQANLIDPDSVDGWSHLGIALMTAGRLEEAVEAFRATLRIEPDNVAALTDLSNVLFMLGKGQEALETLQAAGRLREGDLSILRNLADMYVSAGQLEHALRTTQEMIELSPEDLVARSDAAWLNYQLGRMDEAAAAYRTLKEMAPEADHELYALHGLVMTELKRQNWRRSLELSIEAIRLDRYQFTTLLLRFISSKLFDQQCEVTEKELDERFEAEHHEYRRFFAEVPA